VAEHEREGADCHALTAVTAGSRRVRASQKRGRSADGTCNVAAKALRRQAGHETASKCLQRHSTDAGLPYRDICLQREYDSFDPQRLTTFPLQACNLPASFRKRAIRLPILALWCASVAALVDTSCMVQASRSKVTEIVAADGLLFVLCQSGSCTAFNRGTRLEALLSTVWRASHGHRAHSSNAGNSAAITV
jgi:hypothetical protein